MDETFFEVGYGEADITPQPGIALSGFIFRENKPSTSIDDPLSVRALALRHAGPVHWLISYEVLAISDPLERAISAALETALGADFARTKTVLAATHTHSAPPTSPLEGEEAPSPAYWQDGM
jgi:hypothetical protein